MNYLDGNMSYLLIMVAAISISLAVIPVMVRLASQLGMMDRPHPRKIHVKPIPRVGGWGIVLGALLPAAMLLPHDELFHSYLFGALVLVAFGIWDDRQEVGHYAKFVGQFIAIIPLLTYGGLYVNKLPFLGLESIPPSIAIPFTCIAMVGVINALNHSDGLDGLAGGESLLSLAAITLLAYLSGAYITTLISVATIGGVLGFLRYNTHPATVFMGDGGSQFLGFTLAFLVLLLTQKIDPTLSPAVVLPLLGLPIADILVVLKKRITEGDNWFRASKNHVHHRLLELGFVHQESVIIIYSVQALLVTSGILLRHQNDWLILTFYLSVCTILFALLQLGEKTGWKAHKYEEQSDTITHAITYVRHELLVLAPRRFLDVAIPAYLVFGSLVAKDVTADFGLMAAAILLLLLLEPLFNKSTRSLARRALIYVIAAFVVFLHFDYEPLIHPLLQSLRFLFFALIAISVAVAIRFSPGRRKYEFQTTAMDYLMVFMVLVAFGYSIYYFNGNEMGEFIVKLIIILYACELSVIERRERWTPIAISSIATAAILMLRGGLQV